MVSIGRKRRGRPSSDNRKNDCCSVRMSEDQSNMLDYIMRNTGESKTDILMKGLKMQYNLCKSRIE